MMMIGTIPSELGMLSKVEYFYLSINSLEGAHTPYHSLPCGVCGLSRESMKKNLHTPIPIPHLFTVSMRQRNVGFRFQIPYYSFWSFGMMPSFTGKLPTEVGNMAALYNTLLSTNQLSQSLPSELGRLARLSIFCGDGNRFKVE